MTDENRPNPYAAMDLCLKLMAISRGDYDIEIG